MTDATVADLPDNWGRWGADDELGTLNLITDEVRVKAAAEVRVGRWASLARPITPNPMISGPFAPTTVDVSAVQHMMSYTGVGVAADLMLVTNHHVSSTHIDALAHWSHDGEVYPGRPRAEVVTAEGVTHASTAAFAAGIVTRGVLLDLAVEGPVPPAYAVSSHDFDQAEKRQGVEVGPGDALVVRLGWSATPVPGTPTPGISVDAVRWMHRRGVAVFAGDRGDAFPPLGSDGPSPLHAVGLGRMAMPLIDAVHLDDLAALCAELERYTFLLTIAPPRIHGLTGVPVNPIAVF
ncbi:cyclase [Asanoa ishikariensis]|uniref:Kynurenine formamidase n=1 Tax=Asanoa ishikariensis TaxID=137265 RepID=A0A1H3TTB4_9ACTN|nr:cyclase family protein [Asanoa ishikariensis]GIF61967.1 cyclase [Asanoa ishikariensis]SDZ52559.1 Kynurenine formamidase [Asanoa ishikariensis]